MRRLLILFFLLPVTAIYAQQYDFTHFNNITNFNNPYIYSITQSNGYLWLGTSNGVFRHDGFAFKHYTENDSLASNFVTASLSIGSEVWFGHRSGDISILHDNVIRVLSLGSESPGSVSQIIAGESEDVWIATYSGGLFCVSQDNIDHYIAPDEISINQFIFVDVNMLLIGTDEGVFQAELSKNKLINFKHLVDVPKSKISALTKSNSNSFIIGTEDQGIFELNYKGSTFTGKQIVNAKVYQEEILSSLLIDKNNNLWLGTFGSGLYQVIKTESGWDEQAFSYSRNTAPHIKCLFLDNDETLWIGSYGSGLTKAISNPFFKAEFNFDVQDIVATGPDGIYIAGSSAVFITKHHLKDELDLVLNIDDAEITALDLSGNCLWIGTNGAGLFCYNLLNEKLINIDLGEDRLRNSINIISSLENKIWIGTLKGLAIYDLDSEEFEWVTISTGQIGHNRINDISIASDGSVYIVSQSNVVSIYRKGEWERVDIPSENGMVILNSVHSDSDGNVWLASNGKGVFKIQPDSILNIREAQGLFSDYCYGLSGDNGGLWVLHRNGLSQLDREYLTIRAVKKSAGLTNNDIFRKNGISKNTSDELYFAYSGGILKYAHSLESRTPVPPVQHINSVRFNEKEYTGNFPQKLLPGKYKLKINYLGVSLKEPEQVSYQYRLIGYDEEWSDITTQHEAVFSNLMPGEYIFEIVSANSYGVTSDPLRYSFTIAISIWRQWWFYTLGIIILGLFTALYILRREYKLVQYNKQLEQGVKDRTREIERQKDKIEQQGELLIRKNLDITDSIKYASTIQAAIFPPEEILDEALPKHFLINKPKDIVSGDFCWYTRCEDKYIIAVTDCTGHGVPGAIMSMLGITLFNEVVNNLRVTKAGHILELVRDKVISALNQHKKESPSYDGMNVGLCVLNRSESTIEYAGAFHNLIHFSDNEMNIIKAERTSVGFTPLGSPSFETHTINYKEGDMFYLFSDGYQDQFGGEKDRKFTSKRLLKILSRIHDKEMSDQKLVLVQTLDHWMGDAEQTDDIIILGFRP